MLNSTSRKILMAAAAARRDDRSRPRPSPANARPTRWASTSPSPGRCSPPASPTTCSRSIPLVGDRRRRRRPHLPPAPAGDPAGRHRALAQPRRPSRDHLHRQRVRHRIPQHLRRADRAQGRRCDAGDAQRFALVEEHRQRAGRASSPPTSCTTHGRPATPCETGIDAEEEGRRSRGAPPFCFVRCAPG